MRPHDYRNSFHRPHMAVWITEIIKEFHLVFARYQLLSCAKKKSSPQNDNRRKYLYYSVLLLKLCPDILRIIALCVIRSKRADVKTLF